MERPRLLRYGRAAVTALCLTTCVLVVVLWVRSYFQGDSWYVKIFEWQFDTFSAQGFTQSTNLTGTDDGEDGLIRLEYYAFSPDEPPSIWFGFNASRTVLGFTYTTTEEGNYLVVRHWLIALLFAVVAVIPWLPWRFSLRTLLIAMALVALELGIIMSTS
jgi:hypothetical protein